LPSHESRVEIQFLPQTAYFPWPLRQYSQLSEVEKESDLRKVLTRKYTLRQKSEAVNVRPRSSYTVVNSRDLL
jgi:hypothetical protein